MLALATRKSDVPRFLLVAGINGAGKSTFTRPDPTGPALLSAIATQGRIEVINPDDLTRAFLAETPGPSRDKANLRAAQKCDQLVIEKIDSRAGSFVIETVLSTTKYRPIVERAHALDWQFLFVYIAVDSVEVAIERVARRVRLGGHPVPEDKIRKRWPLSRAQMPWFWRQATRALLYHNPADSHRVTRVAEKYPDGRLEIAPPPIPPAAFELLQSVVFPPAATT